MVAYAWVLPFELKQFRLFPFVIHLDGTKSTNKESRVLFTVSAKDSLGNQFIVLRAFIVNECAWMFKWLFENAMPTLLGKDVLAQVRLVVTDGDSQEYSQMDVAIRKYMPIAFRARCIWHIIDRGMNSHFPKYMSKKLKAKTDKNAFEAFRLIFRRWLWTWAERACETEEEFRISKALLFAYLDSEAVYKIFDPNGDQEVFAKDAINATKEFVKIHVESLEYFFVFYNRKSTFAFETNSNSAHEGLHCGMKTHSAPTNPQHVMSVATSTLCTQAAIRERKIARAVLNEYTEKSLHSGLPTANYLTRRGNGLVENEWNARHLYKIAGPFNREWLLLRQESETRARGEIPIVPRFTRVRSVVCCPISKRLSCSCEFLERTGIPCRHIMKVLSTVHGAAYHGITHEAVHSFWHKSYYFYGIGLHQDNAKGPSAAPLQCGYQGPVLETCLEAIPTLHDEEILTELQKPVWHRCSCYNYDAASGKAAVADAQSTYIPGGLIQETVDFSDMIQDSIDHLDTSQTKLHPYARISPLSKQIVDMTEAIQSDEIVAEVEERLVDIIAWLSSIGLSSDASEQGQRMSLCPARTGKRKTHGTDHCK